MISAPIVATRVPRAALRVCRAIPGGAAATARWAPEGTAAGRAGRAGVASVASAGGVWDGSGSQDDLMLRDTCILVDESDRVIGSASKLDSHVFSPATPTGHLHRAFSVFLFDGQGRLLLQQRALDKKTFAGVWTNTCCSHPLHGMREAELDSPEDVASGRVPGAKAAAVRKLEHELGIPAGAVPASSMAYLTRLLYCAPDPSSAYGEHEMDYILFARRDGCPIEPNPEEVAEVRYVTAAELGEMMDPASGLAWSPWFRIIAKHFLPTWWDRLDEALEGAEGIVDYRTIHKIDAPSQA